MSPVSISAIKASAITLINDERVTAAFGLVCPIYASPVRLSDPAALAEAIARLLDDPTRAAEMGRAGRAFVREHFDPIGNAIRLLDAWEAAR